ncbi:hypothetical protein Ngar_c30070 [Candidatus Nitrososphaera gargensis Ga9.2]|uniref:Uncharacterized protein n=1 Tax=Nitrososphaera gargensis (strain Ga9.2) TaxID=1237085 RepID=K0IIX1_NITGG|nr:hypothetical protein Ngar_c30070 [Candidatus Nitrososphaera gargensis Ga9.2]
MRTMMQYSFQNMNFRGDAKPYQDLLRSMAAEGLCVKSSNPQIHDHAFKQLSEREPMTF